VTTVLVSGCQVSAESREVNDQLHTGELSMSVVDSVIISEKLNSSGSFPGTSLADKLSGYFGGSVELKSGDPVSGSVWMGYLDEAPEEIRASVGEFDQEGYIIRAVKTEEGFPILIITSPSYRGLLYGAGEYEKQLKLTHKVWYDFDVKSEPAFDIRNLWFWSNADFSAEGFVFGHMREPYKHQKFRDLGDLFVSMKINAITLGGRIGEGDTGVDRFIAEAYKEFTKFLRLEYGIDTYVFMLYELSERWGFDMNKIGGGHAYSGLCVHNPSLHRYWEERIDALYEKIPDLGGIVMAGAGGDWVRGPWECRCEQCSKHTHRELVLMAIKMIADPLAKHGGKLMYKIQLHPYRLHEDHHKTTSSNQQKARTPSGQELLCLHQAYLLESWS
jgi:alpha-glucuronidase